jgi:hypothetical protein
MPPLASPPVLVYASTMAGRKPPAGGATMQHRIRVWIAAAVACAIGPSAEAAWQRVAQLQAVGGPKEVAVNRPVSRCLIKCVNGTVIINTVVIREGANKTPFTVAKSLAKGQQHIIELGSNRQVTGCRISDGGGGTYEIHVDARGGGGGRGARIQTRGQWHQVASLQAGGNAKEVAVNRQTRRCLLKCVEGIVIVNTVVVREGASRTPHTVARRLNTGEEAVLDLGAKRPVTGLRISDSNRGRYSVYVE